MKESDRSVTTMDEILHPGITSANIDAGFPDAPLDWNLQQAESAAKSMGMELTADHLGLIKALQHFFARHGEQAINLRELHDALDEHFHQQGGLKHLYEIFPGGPVLQGCKLAGLKAPPGSKDTGYGSAV